MDFFELWTWLGLPVTAIAITGLVYAIRRIIVLVRSTVLIRTPLCHLQQVEFGQAGPVILGTESPIFSRRCAGARFEMRGLNGEPVQAHPILLRSRTSGFTWSRLERMNFNIPAAGRYTLYTTGLGMPQPGDAQHSIVFLRPHFAQAILYVLGIVFSSLITVGSMVLFLLAVLGAGE